MSRTPLMVVSDGPAEPTGLGRIARDLCAHIATDLDDTLDLVQIGGRTPPVWPHWRHYPLDPENADWGASQVAAYWHDCFGSRPGVLWLIWDPARLIPYLDLDLPVQRWAYTPLDAIDVTGGLGASPAASSISAFDRVLAYGRWAASILRQHRTDPVPYLPHGLSLSTWTTPLTADEYAFADALLGPFRSRDAWVLGAVATNQPRKDLGWYCAVLRALRDDGHRVFGWLHVDVVTKAWSIRSLVDGFGLGKHIRVTTTDLTDRDLACLYQSCAVTLAPGLGEGFGYPLVESLAAGTPVIHHTYAGGAELVPKAEWRVPVPAWRIDGIYALRRPVLTAEDGRNAVLRAKAWRARVGDDLCRAYCQGAVAHLDWTALWPRWRAWIRQGL